MLSDLDITSRHTDIYTLGGILDELLAGQDLFHPLGRANFHTQIRDAIPAAPRTTNPNVPRELEGIYLKCFNKGPSEKYASADELADALDTYLRGGTIQRKNLEVIRRQNGWWLLVHKR